MSIRKILSRSKTFFRSMNRQVRKTNGKNSGWASSYQCLEDRKMLASFTGTAGVDTIEINFSGDRPASISINGTEHDVTDSVVELNLDLQESPQFENDVVTIIGDTGHHVVLSADMTEIGANVTIDVGLRGLTLNLEGDASHVIIDDGSFSPSIESVVGTTATVNTGTGADVLVLEGGAVSANLGDGDDLVRVNAFTAESFLEAGAGNDQVEFSHVENHSWHLGIDNVAPDIRLDVKTINSTLPLFEIGAKFSGFEKFIAPEIVVVGEFGLTNTNILKTQSDHHTLVVGSSTWSVPFDESVQVEFVNYNQLDGLGFSNTSVYVAETGHELKIENVNWVNFGGDFQAGDTSGIQHHVALDGVTSLVISNSSSPQPQTLSITGKSIHGLTPIHVVANNVAHANLAGSNTADDTFSISEYDSHVVLFGNGGNDSFYLNPFNRDISIAGQVVNVVGGEGTDSVFIDDRSGDSRKHYRVSDTWVHLTADSPDQRFKGLWHDGVENVDLHTNEFAHQFLVSPGINTQFNLFTVKLESSFQERFFLLDSPVNTHFFELGDDEYSWWFGGEDDDPGLIFVKLLDSE